VTAPRMPPMASRLFWRPVRQSAVLCTIALKYLDNSSDVLEIRGWRGWREFGNGRNSLFKECLRGYTPVRGTLRPVP
jgi:hypothetical protein